MRSPDSPFLSLPGETIGRRGGERVILDAAATRTLRGARNASRNGATALRDARWRPCIAGVWRFRRRWPGRCCTSREWRAAASISTANLPRARRRCCKSAASVWGRGGTPGYVRAWRATANGLEGAAAGATDTVLILDEIGASRSATKWAGRSMRSPTARARRGRRATALCASRRSWRVLTLSTGEVPVDAKLAEDRGKQNARRPIGAHAGHSGRRALRACSIMPGRTATRRASPRRANSPRCPPMERPGRNSSAGSLPKG